MLQKAFNDDTISKTESLSGTRCLKKAKKHINDELHSGRLSGI